MALVSLYKVLAFDPCVTVEIVARSRNSDAALSGINLGGGIYVQPSSFNAKSCSLVSASFERLQHVIAFTLSVR